MFSYHFYSLSYGHKNVKKWLIFCIFRWWQHISHSFRKIFQRIWKILFSSFRKCYGLLVSELLLARCQPLKIQGFGNFCWLTSFLDIFTLNISQTVTSKPINHTFFWNNSVRPLSCTWLFRPNWLFFCCLQPKTQKNEPFLTF